MELVDNAAMSMSIKGCLFVVLAIVLSTSRRVRAFSLLVQCVHMALHRTVEDETQMVVVCYERIDGAGAGP